jgi:hypothetical protein
MEDAAIKHNGIMNPVSKIKHSEIPSTPTERKIS